MTLNYGERIEEAESEKKGATVHKVVLRAPYNFIEPPKNVAGTPWATDAPFADAPAVRTDTGEPDAGKPHAEGINGQLQVDWLFDRAFCVGGAEKANHSHHAHYGGDDDLVLPGSSLRGLIRNVLEITTAARMVHMDREARFAFRNYDPKQVTGKLWQDRVNKGPMRGDPPVFAGMLYPPTGDALNNAGERPRNVTTEGWTFRPGNLARIEQSEAYKAMTGKSQFPAEKTVGVHRIWSQHEGENKKRLVHLAKDNNLFRQINCKIASWPGGNGFEWNSASPIPDSNIKDEEYAVGRVMPVGYFPNKKVKTINPYWGFLYGVDTERAAVPVNASAISAFVLSHLSGRGGRDALQFWLLRALDGHSDGIPVFWTPKRPRPNVPGNNQDKTRIRKLNDTWHDTAVNQSAMEFSLSRFMRLQHTRSVRDVAGSSGAAYQENASRTLDFVQAFMGHVAIEKDGNETVRATPDLPETWAWQSRVFVRHADLVSTAPNPKPTVLQTLSPRPSFSPYYLRADKPEDQHWSSPNAKLAGRKRYPVRDRTDAPAATQNQAARANQQEPEEGTESTVHFRTASDGNPCRFSGPMVLKNVHPVELGGLLWALGFGEDVWSDPDAKPSHRHAMGRGKPQGFGRCFARVTGNQLRKGSGDPIKTEDLSAYVERFKAWLVAQDVDGKGEGDAGSPTAFDDLDHIQELRAMANPAIGAALQGGGKLAYPAAEGLTDAEDASLKGYGALKRRLDRAQPTYLPKYPRSVSG